MDLYFPSVVRVSSSQWDLVDNAGRFRSPLSGSTRVVSRNGDSWLVSVVLNNASSGAPDGAADGNRSAIQAFILAMRGGINSVWLKDHSYTKRGDFPASELLSNNTFSSTTGFSAGSGFALTVSDRVARSARTSISLSGSPQAQVASSFIYSGACTTVAGAAYVARAIVVKGKGYTPHTGFLSIRAGTSSDGSELGTTAWDSFGLISHTFVATGTSTYIGVRDADPESVAVGDYVSIPWMSLSRCARVDGAGQSGTALNIKNLPVSSTSPIVGVQDLILAGDVVQVGDQYLVVTAVVNSASDGTGYIEFASALRASPADDAPVIIHQPMARFMFAGNSAGWTSRPGVFSDSTLEFEEDLRSGFGALVAAAGPSIPSDQYDVSDVRYYGAVGDGTTDDASAINLALSTTPTGRVYFPAGTYLIGSQLTTSDGVPVILYGDGSASILSKGFNGDVISLGKRSEIHDLYIDGNGATYTGRGVVCSTGSLDETSWRRLSRVSIIDMASYCVEFTQATAGYATMMVACRMTTTDQVVEAVKFPDTEASNGNRFMVGCWTFGTPLCNFGACDNATLVGCQGAYPTFNSGTKKVNMNGCRIVQNGPGSRVDWAIKGTNIAITGCVSGVPTITFNNECFKVTFRGNSPASGTVFVDTSRGVTDGNIIDIPHTTYTPTWTGSSVNPAIGDGVLNGSWQRRGDHLRANIKMTGGSTTTFGTGHYLFSVPYTAARRSVGSVLMLDSGTAHKVGTAVIEQGASTVRVIAEAAATFVGTAIPFTWAVSDELLIDIEYPIT